MNIRLYLKVHFHIQCLIIVLTPVSKLCTLRNIIYGSFWNSSNASAYVSESGHRAPSLARKASTTAVSDSVFDFFCAHRSTNISKASAVVI